MLKNIFLLILMLPIVGCVHEANYRGVPAPQWQQLTAEQKQMIVDQAYENEMGNKK